MRSYKKNIKLLGLIETQKNIELNVLPASDDRYIKIKIRT